MAKVIWKPVQNSAPEIFNFLESFSLSYYEYMDLIMEYNKVLYMDLIMEYNKVLYMDLIIEG